MGGVALPGDPLEMRPRTLTLRPFFFSHSRNFAASLGELAKRWPSLPTTAVTAGPIRPSAELLVHQLGIVLVEVHPVGERMN